MKNLAKDQEKLPIFHANIRPAPLHDNEWTKQSCVIIDTPNTVHQIEAENC